MRRGRFTSESPRPTICEQCGTSFTPGRKHAKTCSERCRKRRLRGKWDKPEPGPDPRGHCPQAEAPHPHDAVFNRRTISVPLCREIIGGKWSSLEGLKKAYRDFSMRNHPDRGGDLLVMKRGAVAFDYLTGQM